MASTRNADEQKYDQNQILTFYDGTRIGGPRLMSAPTFLIFDLDGTLSDPVLGIGRCLNHALNFYGHAPIAEHAVTHYVGPPLDASFAAITGVSDAQHIAALVAKYRERYAEAGYAENTLYPDIPAALQELATAGVPMGLCTSKRADFAEQILCLFGLRDYFRFVDGGDVGIRKSQQLTSLLARGAISRQSIMIGDRAVDVEAAKHNHLRSAAVLWGHGSNEELTAAAPDWFMREPSELVVLRQQL